MPQIIPIKDLKNTSEISEKMKSIYIVGYFHNMELYINKL